ncbi:MAG: SGNH/GDSL hydrolase family protein [Planctomycetota bacterium]|nr:SGNH/GDSL hydrolase family protein [Planctomycetota bacterium]
MSTRTPRFHKLIVFTVSAAVALTLAWYVLRTLRKEEPTVQVFDTTEVLAEMMNERLARQLETPDSIQPDGGLTEAYPPPLVREPIDEETAAVFFPALTTGQMVYDPHSYVRRRGNVEQRISFLEHPAGGWTVRTNEQGMREDENVQTDKPDLRILVTGDSHTDGICENSESFPNVLEALLAKTMQGKTVEALNAGTGLYNLFNYLGTFERFAELDPDVFVVAVYGGNDFSGAMYLQRYFNRRAPYKQGSFRWNSKRVGPALESLGPQEIIQEVYFLNHPDDVSLAIDLACSISVELERQCTEAGVQLLFVYLPPPFRGQPAHFEEELREVVGRMRLVDVKLGVSDRIADAWLDFLQERRVPYVDLRPHFRESDELLYWRTDHHLNVAGHRVVGEILLERITDMMNL